MTEEYNISEIQLKYKPRPLSDTIKGSKDIYELLIDKVYDSDTIGYKETFKVLLLNNANRIIGFTTIAEGGLTATVVDLRVILQTALVSNATSIIITHNHPAGRKNPSIQDDMLTTKVAEACKAVELRLLDHIIVTPEDDYYSYCDEGRI